MRSAFAARCPPLSGPPRHRKDGGIRRRAGEGATEPCCPCHVTFAVATATTYETAPTEGRHPPPRPYPLSRSSSAVPFHAHLPGSSRAGRLPSPEYRSTLSTRLQLAMRRRFMYTAHMRQ